jgi:hypothetical protein
MADHSDSFTSATEEIARLRRELQSIEAENLRLHRLLGVTGRSVVPDQPSQHALFVGTQGRVDAHSPVERKLALYRTLFAGRRDVHALRWENARTGKAGWVPAVEGGWRKQGPRNYLPLTDDVLASHLTGDTHAGLYPLMPGDVCRLVVADFDGQAALLDALAYLKAARAVDIPASLEVSRSGTGAHVWIFFSGNVPASPHAGSAPVYSAKPWPFVANSIWPATTASSIAGLLAGIWVDRQPDRAPPSRRVPKARRARPIAAARMSLAIAA